MIGLECGDNFHAAAEAKGLNVTMRRLRDWLLANDPAFSRLRLAGRVTLTIVATLAILFAVTQVWALPPAAYGLAITLSIQSGLAVRDSGPARQFVTRMTGCLVAVIIVALAAMLEPYRIVSDITFLVVIFVATYARAYGPRWSAVGMFAFMSYFIGAYMHPSLDQLPGIAFGVFVAALVAHIVATFMLPDRWQRDLKRSVVALDRRIDGILDDLADLSAEGEVAPKRRAQLFARVGHFKDAVLMTESFIPQPRSDTSQADDPASALTMALFDLHLAVESTAVLGLQSPPDDGMLDSVRHFDAAGLAHAAKSANSGAPAETAGSLVWLDRARRTLGESVETVVTVQGLLPPAPLAPPPASSAARFSLGDPALRTAIQITLATTVAMIFGLMLSRDRWFWAVLSAFLVFTNTRSRGDTMVRALQRSGGTLLGLVAGIGVAILLSGYTVAAAILALACIFLAFYILPLSYTAMTFFVSIVLALAYSLMGVLTPQLLQLRLEETLIGSAAGIGAAFLVFPTRTRATLDKALDVWFQAMADLLEASASDAAGLQMIERSQALERAYRDLANAARPLGVSWQMVTRPGHVRQTLAIFMGATYWAKIAAHGLAHPTGDPARVSTQVQIEERLKDLRQTGAACFYVERPVRTIVRRHLPLSERKVDLALEMIGILLARLTPAPAAKPA